MAIETHETDENRTDARWDEIEAANIADAAACQIYQIAFSAYRNAPSETTSKMLNDAYGDYRRIHEQYLIACHPVRIID